jgi:hypothetical protein
MTVTNGRQRYSMRIAFQNHVKKHIVHALVFSLNHLIIPRNKLYQNGKSYINYL